MLVEKKFRDFPRKRKEIRERDRRPIVEEIIEKGVHDRDAQVHVQLLMFSYKFSIIVNGRRTKGTL